MYYERAQSQTKKDYYKRLAQMKRNKWIKYQNSTEDDHPKQYYIPQEDIRCEHEEKSKKIVKGEIRIEQKLRNRAAAQESRQRHRCYVAQLEKKVKIYQELLEKQGLLCKNCKKNLLSQTNIQNETIIVQEFSDHSSSLKFFNNIESQDEILNSFLSDQLIRIDNKDAPTPFAVFFIICLIGVIAIFGIKAGDFDMASSLLVNYQSTVQHPIQNQNKVHHIQLQPNYMHIKNIQSHQRRLHFERQDNLDSFLSVTIDKDFDISKNQTKIQEQIISELSLIVLNQLKSQSNKPQMFVLRNFEDSNKSYSHLLVNRDENQTFQSQQKIELISSQSLRQTL